MRHPPVLSISGGVLNFPYVLSRDIDGLPVARVGWNQIEALVRLFEKANGVWILEGLDISFVLNAHFRCTRTAPLGRNAIIDALGVENRHKKRNEEEEGLSLVRHRIEIALDQAESKTNERYEKDHRQKQAWIQLSAHACGESEKE